jgi:hypothetical protein
MSHFAKVENGVVVQVIVADEAFISSMPDAQAWVQTSYNTRGGTHLTGGTPLRKNYAGIGYTYDAERDAFIPPPLFPSWLLDEDTCQWTAPAPYPDDGKVYDWDEATLSWIAMVSA